MTRCFDTINLNNTSLDCIHHGIPIAKMKANGFSDEDCTFMSSYIAIDIRVLKFQILKVHGLN